MQNNKLLGLLGFAIKSRNLIAGLNACEKYLSKKRGNLLIISPHLAENSRNKLLNSYKKNIGTFRILENEELFQKIFPDRDIKCFLIVDCGFADQILKCIDETTPKKQEVGVCQN